MTTTATPRIGTISQFDGQTITLNGWVFNKRSSGKIKFLMLRDGSGIIQGVLVKGECSDSAFEGFDALTQESSVIVTGKVRAEPRSKIGFELTVLDVRSAEEFNGPDGRVAGSVLISLPELVNRISEIPADRPVVVVCHSGSRSALATQQLLKAGLDQVANLLDLWRQDQFDPDRVFIQDATPHWATLTLAGPGLATKGGAAIINVATSGTASMSTFGFGTTPANAIDGKAFLFKVGGGEVQQGAGARRGSRAAGDE
jgi:rhodanese-related sulfurtransferase